MFFLKVRDAYAIAYSVPDGVYWPRYAPIPAGWFSDPVQASVAKNHLLPGTGLRRMGADDSALRSLVKASKAWGGNGPFL